VWKLPTSTQILATRHTDSLDMVVLPSTGVSRYHNCWVDGGTSSEYFGYPLVYPLRYPCYILQGDSLARSPKLLEKRIQVCLDVKWDHFQHRLW
jgi:hypothetical protein